MASESVTLAAERLGISQPAVSQHVARFEQLSGISVFGRNNDASVVRSEAAVKLLDAMFEVECAIGRIARCESPSRLRLGICDSVATRYCADVDLCLDLRQMFDIHVGHSSGLLYTFTRGELDLVLRPMFHNESEQDLMTTVPLVWVGPEGSSEDAARGSDVPVPVILNTSLSPYAHYAEQALSDSGVAHKTVARIDDHKLQFNLVTKGMGCALIPAFLDGSLPVAARTVSHLPTPTAVRFGLFRSRKSVGHARALDMFDMFRREILCH